MLKGNASILIQSRKRLENQPEKTMNLPLYFACCCRYEDYPRIKLGLKEEKAQPSAIQGLGLLGMGASIPLLIQQFSYTITSKEEWELNRTTADALELITGESLDLPFPDIVEGPEDKRHELKVVIDWRQIWAQWWMQNSHKFKEKIRYRRGKKYTLASGLEEMAFSRGNFWSRQYAYYELQARSGNHVHPFYADWYVADQLKAIDAWQQWWEENKAKFPDSQWLYQGREHWT
jgi:hypothetical protein